MSRKTTTSTDVMNNLSNLLPTGTFLAFQTLAPLFTNNGQCARVEKIMTALLIAIFEIICFVFNFTDSITTQSGKVYYGNVTERGLFNPRFKGSSLPDTDGMFYKDSRDRYVVGKFDFIHGALNILTLGTLAMFTSPVSTCYYPNIPSTIVKCVPILVGLTVGLYFAFAPNARQGVGFAILTNKVDLIPDTDAKSFKNSKHRAQASLLGKGDSRDSSRHTPPHFRNARENPIFEPTLTPSPRTLCRSLSCPRC